MNKWIWPCLIRPDGIIDWSNSISVRSISITTIIYQYHITFYEHLSVLNSDCNRLWSIKKNFMNGNRFPSVEHLLRWDFWQLIQLEHRHHVQGNVTGNDQSWRHRLIDIAQSKFIYLYRQTYTVIEKKRKRKIDHLISI